MSQFDIRSIREVSNDPLTKFTNEIAKKLSKFLNQQQTDKLENKEDIYSNGQDIDTVIKYHSELSSTKRFDFNTQFFPPTEPDGDKVRLWLKGRNLGNDIRDISGFGNNGTIEGDPVLVDGTPFDYGIHTGGVKSIANRFNRPTSLQENLEHISVPHNTNFQVAGITTGISYFIRFKIYDLSSQDGLNRTLIEKTDGPTPDNGVLITVTPSGNLRFHLKRGGTEYNKQTASSTIATGTVYEVFCTYANSGNVSHIYVNNVDKTLTDPGSPTWHSDLTNKDLSVFRRGEGSDGGHLYGDFYDLLIYRDKVVSGTEVGRHYTNKWTISNIPFGQVMVPNYWATYAPSPSPSSFTTTSFTSTSFTT